MQITYESTRGIKKYKDASPNGEQGTCAHDFVCIFRVSVLSRSAFFFRRSMSTSTLTVTLLPFSIGHHHHETTRADTSSRMRFLIIDPMAQRCTVTNGMGMKPEVTM